MLILFASISSNGQQADVTICWDTSLSMKDRNVSKEFSFLNTFFAENKNTSVRVLLFSNQIIKDEAFTIENGNWEKIKIYLSTAVYDGATSYSQIAQVASSKDILLFTDGHRNINLEAPKFKGALQIITSDENGNKEFLDLLAVLNAGKIINVNSSTTGTNTYVGRVMSGEKPLPDVIIFIKGTSRKVITDSDGRYAIDAAKGETIVFNQLGKEDYNKVLDDTTLLNIKLDDKAFVLDEVTVTENAVTTNSDGEKIATAYGEENKDTKGYAVETYKNDNKAFQTDASQTVQGKFAGVQVGSGLNKGANTDLSRIRMRTDTTLNGSNYSLVVVDGVPLPQGRDLSFIAPEDIADITVLKGLAATNKYGSLGRNGVLLITTKISQGIKSGKQQDLARLKNNIYEDELIPQKLKLNTPYIKALKKGKNLGDAYDIYLKQRQNNIDNPVFYIDVYNFFKVSDADIANRILSNVLEQFSENENMLKALAYTYQVNGNHDTAQIVLNKVLQQNPSSAQAYLDVALGYRNLGKYQDALNMLNEMAKGTYKNVDFNGVKKQIDAELKNLYTMHKSKLDFKNIDATYQRNVSYDAKIVVDYNDKEAEFVLQFVNPDKRFFKWEHTSTATGNRIQNEKLTGFNSEEFELIGAQKGDWLINIEYVGKSDFKNTTPSFIKATIYHNYGSPSQRIEHQLIRLSEAGSKLNLAKLKI
ncbi:tetratricopeptide repeat protein [Spongiivirga citrea]|uniref:tetratricopeptide repeat protein n=1 Tax=Spongiivirga citrea TaxID=1481457 RepID=UPI001953DA0B|nr:tetratricopeptide repeat protein [Spongiivirga citrea]